MERILIHAEYKRDNTFSDGFICISKDGKKETIEGFFTDDYVRLFFLGNDTLCMFLYESKYFPMLPFGLVFAKSYKCKNLYNKQIYSPEEYHFKCNDRSLVLRTLGVEKSKEKIEKVFTYLDRIRS